MTMTMNPSNRFRTTTTNPAATSSATSPAWFDRLQRGAVIASTVTMGLAAGFFFTYQVSVTRGLAIVDDRSYVEIFQAINETVRNAWFGIVFFGSIPILTASLALNWRTSRRARTLLGTSLGLYLATVAITAVGNIALNEELATVTERSPEVLAAARSDFEQSWNDLNLARTLTCFGALVAVALGGSRSSPRQQACGDEQQAQ